jgi:hypothetical protein
MPASISVKSAITIERIKSLQFSGSAPDLKSSMNKVVALSDWHG